VRRSAEGGGAVLCQVQCRPPPCRVSTLRGRRNHGAYRRPVRASCETGGSPPSDDALVSDGTGASSRVSVVATSTSSPSSTSVDPTEKEKASSWKSSQPRALGVPTNQLPGHIAIIMDGNARWANDNGLPINLGHEKGVEALRTVTRCASAWGVDVVTVYAFSHENWKRSKHEVSFLMKLLEKTLVDELFELNEQGIKICVMGDLGMVSDTLRTAAKNAAATTKNNKNMRLNVALSYGARQVRPWSFPKSGHTALPLTLVNVVHTSPNTGLKLCFIYRKDLVQAARSLALDAAAGHIAAEDITEEMIAERLSSNFSGGGYDEIGTGGVGTSSAGKKKTAASREPDLLIRTSGEQVRISHPTRSAVAVAHTRPAKGALPLPILVP